MPRKFCESCKRRPMAYRLYETDSLLRSRAKDNPRNNALSIHVCKACAIDAVRRGTVFNLRRLMTQHPDVEDRKIPIGG